MLGLPPSFLLLALLPLLAIVGTASASVLLFRYKRDLIRAVDPVRFPRETGLALAHNDWAEQNGFQFLGSYQVTALGTAYVAAWERVGEPTYFCVYCMGDKVARDFVTILNGDGGLTTGNSADALLFPAAPGEYKQTFPGTLAEEQWERHLAAIEFLKQHRHATIRSRFRSFDEAFAEGVRGPAAYVMTLFLWPLRAPYWYFVRRSRMRGKPVEQLIQEGWLN